MARSLFPTLIILCLCLFSFCNSQKPSRKNIVPNLEYISQSKWIRPGNTTYETKIERGQIISRDPRLESDANQIWKFFRSQLSPPRAFVIIDGFEDSEEPMVVAAGNGEYTDVPVLVPHHTAQIVLEVTDYVSEWEGINSLRDGKTIRQVIQEFVEMKRDKKNIKMTKDVFYSEDIKAKVIAAMHSSMGISGMRIEVQVQTENSVVSVESDHRWGVASVRGFGRVVPGVVRWFRSAQPKNEALQARYSLELGDFVSRNFNVIYEAFQTRSFVNFKAQ